MVSAELNAAADQKATPPPLVTIGGAPPTVKRSNAAAEAFSVGADV
jgi:hypothetical protein